MSPLTLTLLRFGFLALLWIFVLLIVITIKNDVFGTAIRDRAARRPARSSQRHNTPAAQPPRPAPNAQPHWQLVVSAGDLTGTTIPLGNSALTVGRSPDSALVLDDGFASARHARFYTDGADWYIEDLNSTNGTWVNNTRIYQPTRLAPGVPIIIGKTTMELRR
ncbi:FHA domain-containing protein [Trueperella sp. LYQ143]|uniref:FHA domain-containing protein FhaB/FipA n=1 Tax=unclassified Trueperella TaxID=2630174 RepID=UPI003983D43E